jgi:hypothetical protein
MYGYDGDLFLATGLDRNKSTGKTFGSGDYCLAVPQFYGEVGYGNVSLKVGKFFLETGLDSYCSPRRFFYSTSFASKTRIHSGALVTWDYRENLSFFGGWVNGENQFFTGDSSAFLGGMNWKFSPRLRFDYSLLAGSDNGNHDYVVSSLVARFKVTHRWDYAVGWLMGYDSFGSNNRWGMYGIDQELFYALTDYWTLGFGLEWLHVWDKWFGQKFDDDIFSLRFGANWKPNDLFTLRPELRYDTVPNGGDLLTVGISAMITF